LLTAILGVLKEWGSDLEQILRTLTASAYAVGPKGVELARPAYLWEPLARFFPEAMTFADQTEHAFLRLPWPETHLALVAKGGTAVSLTITARLPARAGLAQGSDDQVQIAANGESVASVPLTRDWERRRVSVPAESLKRGLNRLTLRWPPLTAAGTDMLEQALARLEQGLPAEVHPVFGEVWSVWAETV
jgi:hypothetical protein